MPFTLKKLANQDLNQLKELRMLYASAFDEEDSFRIPISDSHLQQLLQDSRLIFLVALNERGDVCGGLSAYLLPSLKSEKAEIYLYDIAVSSQNRRQGIATQLIDTLIEIARRQNASVVFVQAEKEDAPAVALYHKLCSSFNDEVIHYNFDC